MNNKGQAGVMGRIIFAIVAVIGVLIFVLISTPFVAILSDSAVGLNNTEIFYMGTSALLLIRLFALILIAVILLMLLSPSTPLSIRRPPEPQF